MRRTGPRVRSTSAPPATRPDADVDTLWWFDGESTWHATKLRAKVPAPVTAVLADPAHPEIVYVGTTVGVFRGTRTLTGPGAPTWDWAPLVRGLPEAPVEDLALFDQDGIRLLRAGIVARGVWELRLGTHGRGHDVRALPRRRPALPRGRRGARPRPDHGAVVARLPRRAPPPGAWPPSPRRPASPWTLRGAAVDHAAAPLPGVGARTSFGDPRFRATGVWDRYFDEALKDHGSPVGPAGRHRSPRRSTTRWSPGRRDRGARGARRSPTLADLLDVSPSISEGSVGQASRRVQRKPYKIDVVVHRRGLDADRRRPGAGHAAALGRPGAAQPRRPDGLDDVADRPR